MAANLHSRRLANFTKQFVSRVHFRYSPAIRQYVFGLRTDCGAILNQTPTKYTLYGGKRGVHVSTYDKNPEEDHAHSAVVPDNVIPSQTRQYWAPHPKTGVFGPAKDGPDLADEDGGSNSGTDSVLEQKAFFRPLEDLDKPQHP